MGPLCSRLPKPLLPVAGRALLLRLLDGLAAAGARRIVVVVEHRADQVEAAVAGWTAAAAKAPTLTVSGVPDRTGSASSLSPAPGVSAVCVRQGQTRGTGHAVATARPHLKDNDGALVVMGDCVVDPAVLRALAAEKGFALAAKRVPDARPYGALEVEGNRVLALHEKSESPPSDLVNTGCYRVPADALDATLQLRPSVRGELEFVDVVNQWAGRGALHWVPGETWVDVGSPWDYLRAHESVMAGEMDRLLAQQATGSARQPRSVTRPVSGVGPSAVGGPGLVEDGVHVRGRLWVGPGTVVKSGTYVEGDVLIGASTRIGPNSYLRGPVAIGSHCHVGASVELKNTILFDHAHAPHLHYLGDSILGHNVNLGAGTKVANLKVKSGTVKVLWGEGAAAKKYDTGRVKLGAFIGDDAKLGINCSLNPGTVVGAGAQVGAGKVLSGWIPDGARLL